ncbi:MAG: molecular chaperone HtpG [Bacteroidetes bacterium]|nr:molecular chaperone HtpG [Bacteroidota bacterium]MBL6943741.1 molecular chaperone HtpG [Bacteroidales bacterium]
MTVQKGKIDIKTEDIFPIIKKFLYSDHEIFLRELISNATDASQKLKTLASLGKFTGELGDLTILVEVDKKKKTITVRDRGLGMTGDEVKKYINQIAFSSAEDFVKKFKTKSEAEQNNIIGHFGLGFYSSFMVSDKVEIKTKTYKKGGQTKAVRWECDGSPDFSLEEIEKDDRGTEVILHIDDENKEFLENYKINELLTKYCKFLPVPIQFGTKKIQEPIEGKKDKDGNQETKEVEKPKIINNTNPLWKKKPSEATDEDYKNFYRELYPYSFEEPLFHIHLNVDYPFNLTGILYFPKVKKDYEMQRNKIQLYSNQVFVTDSVEGIVPDFLTLLHGVIDSPDIPLNVSRSYLQSDGNVKKISSYIMRKVADKLAELFKKDRESFEKKWDDIKIFIAYGMISEEKFYEKAEKFALLKNVEGKYFTFAEYKKTIEKTQKDKDKKLVYLYAKNKDEQYSYIESATERGYDVLLMDGVLDSHLINTLEQKFKDSTFARVDSNTIDKIISKEDEAPSKLDDKQKETLKEIIERNINKETYHVAFENLSETDMPVTITQNEFMRRMKDMEKIGGGGMMMGMGNFPETFEMIVNTNNPLITKIMDEEDAGKQDGIVKQMYDLARLAKNLLVGKELNDFVKRNVSNI